jgi:hypothetical protein
MDPQGNDLSSEVFNNLAIWLNRHGMEEAFISVCIVLLFLYFLRTIFRPTNESILHEIKELLIEIKTFLMGDANKK